jgi:uncharacterized membrane protein
MNSVFSLGQWIKAATKNLAPEAILSITKEITDHYQTSLEHYQANGISSMEAQQKAVLELGNPKTAARAFEREYLTKEQVRRFTPESSRSKWLKMIVIAFWSVILGTFFWDFRFRYPSLVAAFSLFFAGISLFLFLGLLFDSVSRVLLQRYRSIPMVIFVIGIEYFAVSVGILVWYLFAPVPFKIPLWLCSGLITFLSIGVVYSELPTLQKLRARA